MKHKRILLLPTPFYVDVFVGGTIEEVEETLNELRGKEEKYFRLELKEGGQAMTAEAEGAFFMLLPDFLHEVISHEATHVTWLLGDKIGLDWDYQSQELQAYYIDYIVQQINKMKE